jgi:hypothetical protein
VLHVATALSSFVDFYFFIGDAITIGIAVGPEVEGVGDADHDAVVEGEDHAGEEEVIDEDGVLVVDAVARGVFVAGDPGGGFLLALGIGVLHVGSHFDDVEGSVSVPGHGDGFVDVWIGEDEVEGVVVLKLDRFLGVLDGEEAFLVNGVAGFGEEGGGE